MFTLEVAPLDVDKVYDELPLHCTLMHRFWTHLSPAELVAKTQDVFAVTKPLTLNATERKAIGPKRVQVALLGHTQALEQLNMMLYHRLNLLGVEYAAPQWVGSDHIFHVTDRPFAQLAPGQTMSCGAAYLIEVKVPGYDHSRIARAKTMLGQTE